MHTTHSTTATFDTHTPITATVNIPAGRIRFIAADRTDTTIEVLPADPTKNRDVKTAQQTTIDYHDTVLRIETPANNQYFGPSGTVDVTIQLPTGSHVQARTASTEIRGVGKLGNVTLQGAQATAKLDETATAHLTIHTGDITIGRLTGSAHISTRKGDLNITEATHGTLTLHTEHGDITLATPRATPATLHAHTTHGHIHNSLNNTNGPTTNLTIHATTTHGNITARSL
ncbi:DUF4097 family beta strand repeat-containing protein [Streptomyces sp. NPDC092370]|uniref:DUF4097 family beta strand repeat-containing protein n=1 Tax=Streptomyces sp. NPDC092370 TaxID=3366016 RepID=UPI00381F870F